MDHYAAVIISILAAHVVVVIAPGPNFLLTMTTALSYTRQNGIYTAMGIATGTTVYCVLGFLGFIVIVSQSIVAFTLIKLAGAAYLIYVGIHAIRRRGQPVSLPGAAAGPAMSLRRVYRRGFLTCMSNPKAGLYFLALFTTLVPPGTPLGFKVAVTIMMPTISLTWYSLVAMAFSNGHVQHIYRRAKKGLDAVFGTVFIALGVRLLTVER